MSFFNLKIRKYTCSCCGYKSLPTNDMGEICPICYWEEDYYAHDDLFCISSSNHMTLYQAQINYKKFDSCCKRISDHCRKPSFYENKDKRWRSIQCIVESKYSIDELIIEIENLGDNLKRKDAYTLLQNYKCLDEKIISLYEEIPWDHEFILSEDGGYLNQLKLQSFLWCIFEKASGILLMLFKKYYQKGVTYYVSWSIVLSVIMESKMKIEDDEMNNILLEIEINGYYGLKYLQKNIEKYWNNYSSAT